ncbi:MAG: acetyl-CoA carboxylase carboxyltransferase subunit alpha [Bacteriovoracaceae bacterium]
MDQNDNFALDFEKPVKELEDQIYDLKEASKRPHIDLSAEVEALQNKVQTLLKDIYQNLSIWERVQISRHPKRPHTVDYLENLFDEFEEIKGDRFFANDPAVITGFAYIGKQKFCVVGIEKGRKTKDKIKRNFGMPRPEGYRKAKRVMDMASRFNLPIITLVDTPGAYPGIGAEERGQSSAIAESIMKMFDLNVPVISIIIGEGGSGGALGIAVADKVLMLEHSIYSVISPESCASILWADPKMAENAANALKLESPKAFELGVVDEIVTEPIGGAHRSPKALYESLGQAILKNVDELRKLEVNDLKENRYKKFRTMGNQTITNVES